MNATVAAAALAAPIGRSGVAPTPPRCAIRIFRMAKAGAEK
jgi:hypothetical protein